MSTLPSIQGPRLQAAKADMAKVDKAAQEFESVFLNQMLSLMWETVDVDPTFGGGHGEEMFRSVLIDEQAKAIGRSGGLGLAANIKEQMLRMQETAEGRSPTQQLLEGGRPLAARMTDAYATTGDLP
ncbi:MAG TPA: rod-binding protein [Azospirillaceae bacterium]|nr:rod-binding protein [Azospirillaceae bacterium]